MKTDTDWLGSGEGSELAHGDLACLRESTQHGYDVAGGLDTLKARIAADPAAPVEAAKAAPSAKLLAGLMVGGAGALVVASAVFFFGGAARESTSAAPRPAASAIEAPAPPPLDHPAPAAAETASVRVDELPNAPSLHTSPAPKPPSAPTMDTVDAELAHAARLRTLARSAPQLALREADEGNRRFGRGVLSEERDAIAIDALVRLGRTEEMRARAEEFLRAHPRGPRAERVRALVAGTIVD